MRHARIEMPAYIVWVEARPTHQGKGKTAYYDAVQAVARAAIATPITSSDIEIEIVYSTTAKQQVRLDTDNVNKPTLDALKGVAYVDDAQVRRADSRLFDRTTTVGTVHGRVEHIERLFFNPQRHVLMILIYSDTRLAELGGAQVVEQQRYLEWQREQGDPETQLRKRIASTPPGDDFTFDPAIGAWHDRSRIYYCMRCWSEQLRTPMKKEEHSYRCMVCGQDYSDPAWG
jgi:DNA-directed RNA polymerase subunit RPC12/RpoP